jgi:hypothetical protein
MFQEPAVPEQTLGEPDDVLDRSANDNSLSSLGISDLPHLIGDVDRDGITSHDQELTIPLQGTCR